MLMEGLVVVHDPQILLPPPLNIIRPRSVHRLQVSLVTGPFELHALCGVCDWLNLKILGKAGEGSWLALIVALALIAKHLSGSLTQKASSTGVRANCQRGVTGEGRK